MPNMLTEAIRNLRVKSVQMDGKGAGTELLDALRDACLASGGPGVGGLVIFFDEGRLYVSFRGDEILNWRAAGSALVMETAIGELAIARTLDEALILTAREVSDHLPASLNSVPA